MMTLTIRKIIVLGLIGMIFLMANILVVTNWLAEKELAEKANWLREEFLTGTAIAVIIALLVFLFIKFSSNTISDKELSEGTFFNLEINEQFKFDIDEKEHKLILDAFGKDYVHITLRSELIEFTLKIGESRKFDLNNDGVYDLRIRLGGCHNIRYYI